MAAKRARKPGGTSVARTAPRAATGRQRAAQPPARGRHARARAAPRAAAANRQAAAQAAAPQQPGGQQGQQGGGQQGQQGAQQQRKPVGARELAANVTERKGGYSGKRMLTAELIVAFLIVAVRAVADYEPQADGTIKGKIAHPKGQYGPLPILAGLIMTFFVLSFLAASGGTKARLAVIAGGIIDIALLMKSADEFKKVADTFGGNLGTGQLPAGDWQTEGTAAGTPIQSDSGSGASSSGGGGSGTVSGSGFDQWLQSHPGGTYAQYLQTHQGAGVIGPAKSA